MKQFTTADVVHHGDYARIYVGDFREALVYDPPAWMAKGLQETASGYGKRLNSGYRIHYNGKLYRLYTTIFSNNGTTWFKCKGQVICVS